MATYLKIKVRKDGLFSSDSSRVQPTIAGRYYSKNMSQLFPLWSVRKKMTGTLTSFPGPSQTVPAASHQAFQCTALPGHFTFNPQQIHVFAVKRQNPEEGYRCFLWEETVTQTMSSQSSRHRASDRWAGPQEPCLSSGLSEQDIGPPNVVDLLRSRNQGQICKERFFFPSIKWWTSKIKEPNQTRVNKTTSRGMGGGKGWHQMQGNVSKCSDITWLGLQQLLRERRKATRGPHCEGISRED